MIYSNDFIMREIQGLARFMAQVLFQKGLTADEIIDENAVVAEDMLLEYTLMKLVREGRINEAENRMFEEIEREPQLGYLQLALRLYTEVAKYGDEQLAAFDYSRQEIAEGIAAVKKIYEKQQL